MNRQAVHLVLILEPADLDALETLLGALQKREQHGRQSHNDIKSASQNLAYPALRRQVASCKERRRRRTPLWYVEEERRRRWPPGAATHRLTIGWAELRRRAALLVGCVLATSTRPSRALRGSQLGPAQGTGDSGTHSKVMDGDEKGGMS